MKKTVLLLAVMAWTLVPALAQYCDSDGHNNSFEWISNVSLNTINNASGADPNGYGNYTAVTTDLTIGQQYSITVDFDGSFGENLDIWIDFDQNQVFDPAEKVLSDNGAGSITGTINVPGGATQGSTRMRIIMNFSNPTTDPCIMGMNFGEVEDYSVNLLPNTQPPVANFRASDTLTCGGTLTTDFTDLSTAVPTTWSWEFGDGNTSTIQHPTHTYTTPGTYTVTLTASNSFGQDSHTKTDYIAITNNGPILPACTPATTNYCCGIGVHNFTFNTINNSTNDGVDGYQDYSCGNSTTVLEGQSYSISVDVGSGPNQDVRAWIDYNNDGSFGGAGEQVFASDNMNGTHTGTVNIPLTAVTGTALRMRVGSDFSGTTPDHCTDATWGQFEDYNVTISPSNVPPTADLEADVTFTCTGLVNFLDISTGVPATSWSWDFGDGNTDNVQHPTHTYTIDGLYTVTLVATNSHGSDTATKTDYITVSTSGGPVAPSCQPHTYNYCCGFGITNVTFNTINNTSGDGNDGYQDYACNFSTNLQEGVSYTLSVTVDNPADHNTSAWIDFNNDGVFDNVTEKVMEKASEMYPSENILIPGTAVKNTPLRLRISADFDGNPMPGPCDSVERGQVEDYTVVILPNTDPPVAAFDVDKTLTCDGTVSFTDMSQNVPDSWSWDFGDGNTDTLQHPTHTYTTSGTFDVKLVVTNPYGVDSVVQNGLVQVTLGSTPVAASCTPATLGYCCGYGIYNVTYNTINNSTGDGSEDYQDYTCTHSTSVTEGISYTIDIETSPSNAQDTRVWIDLDNNGTFSPSTELMFSSDNSFNPSGTINIPSGAVLNTPLRMRITSDVSASNPGPCTNPSFGQTEDYTVTVLQNTNPPTPAFEADTTITCDGLINFTDLSTNAPSTWSWDFGDGNTSNVQHPSHTYTTTGLFTVKLVACNSFGCDSASKTDYVNVVSTIGPPTAPTCSPITLTPFGGFGITNVILNTINNTTNDGIDSYQDYSCISQTTLTAGVNYSINVSTSTFQAENVRVWIDLNDDGNFDTTEMVFESLNVVFSHSGTVNVPGTAVLNTPLRMRVMSDMAFAGLPDPCTDVQRGQCEDYGVTIIPNTNPPVAAFEAPLTTVCTGTVQFTDLSENLPTSWDWDFGDGNTSTQQHPTNVYTSVGTYTVKLVVTNAFGQDSINKINYIDVTSLAGAIAPNCTPQTLNYSNQEGIYNVTFNTIDHTTGDAQDGYQDYSCDEQTTVDEGQTYTLEVETGPFAGENVRVWIDYNNDGVFDELTEQVMATDNVFQNHTANVTIPPSSVKNTALRMRVATSAVFGFPAPPPPTPCDDIQLGQAEDYSIIIEANQAPPDADFLSDRTYTCDGTIQFTDNTLNLPTSWQWDFGDGNTSSAQNPSHTYAISGTYTVTLTATNSFGADSIVKVNLVTVGTAPLAPPCTPVTMFYCCGFGIYNVSLNDLDHSSNDGIDGFQDYSCVANGTVVAGESYTVEVETGPTNPENVRIWIDFNNDGVLDQFSEEAFVSDNVTQFHSGQINIPTNAVQNTPLRMRVASDVPFAGGLFPCNDVQRGQMEDYTLIVLPNTIPPVADFDVSSLDECQGIFQFEDQSLVSPNSWDWDFGDGTGASGSQNPLYTFSAPGTYTVTLISTNPFGSDTIKKPVQVNSILADFTLSHPVVGIGQGFTLTDKSMGADTWKWDFGDGFSSTVQSPIYSYTNTGIYDIKLTATNSASECVDIATAQVEVVESTGVADSDPDNAISIYPIPVTDFLVLELAFSETRSVSWSVFNALGDLVLSGSPGDIKAYRQNLDIHHMPKGVYFMKVAADNEQYFKRFVIQ